MKASLYALHDGQGWTWHTSIRLDTDVQFWFERYGGEARLLLLEPSFSLGQAEMLRRQLQDRKGADFELTAPKFVQDKLQKPVHAAAFRLKDFMPSAASAVLSIDPLVYSQMVEALRGRLLLFEEGKQLLEERGIGGGAGSEQDWTSYLQLAKLRGDIELTNGFDFQEKRKLPWLKNVLEYTCKRCGSGTEKMHWSECLFCGQKCPYCEECLTMGRNRFCSVLLRGREKRRNSAASSVSNEADLSGYMAPWGLSEA
jgi:competence protein ComFA